MNYEKQLKSLWPIAEDALRNCGKRQNFCQDIQSAEQDMVWTQLMLRSGTAQGVPCTATILLCIVRPYLSYNHS